jgi:hypothetical protein
VSWDFFPGDGTGSKIGIAATITWIDHQMRAHARRETDSFLLVLLACRRDENLGFELRSELNEMRAKEAMTNRFGKTMRKIGSLPFESWLSRCKLRFLGKDVESYLVLPACR